MSNTRFAFGTPVCATYTNTGTGLPGRLTAVKWDGTINLLYAWILTIPVSIVIAALGYYYFKFTGL